MPDDRNQQFELRWRIPRSKVAAPRVPATLVSRVPLRELLNQASDVPITMVCAPAGYGKTLLLAEWVETEGRQDKAWVTLDGDDNDANQFWAAVLTAICACEVVPTDSRLRELVPPADSDSASFVAELVDALDALPGRLALVLDDVQEVVDPTTLHGIAALIRHQPANLRLVLSSRSDPPLPLARLHMQGGLVEIRANRLRFSEEDADALLRNAGVELDRDQVRRLVAQTDGWAAALRLAARSLRTAPDRNAFLTDFANNDRSVSDYLAGEVLTRLTDEVREFLWVVSVCDEVAPALAAELSGRDDAGVVLDSLESESSFVMGVDTGRQWYRIHPLMRSYLRADLDRQRPEQAAELHRVAAAWFLSEKRPYDALFHAGRTGDNADVIELLRDQGAELVVRGDHQLLGRALAMLGKDVVAGDAWLSLLRAAAHVELGELAEAESDLAAGAAAWPGDPGDDLVCLRHLVTSTHALAVGRPPPTGSMTALETAPPHQRPGLAAWTQLVLGCAALYDGERESARRIFTAARLAARRRGFDYAEMHCLIGLAALSALEGNYAEMSAACSESVAIARARGWQRPPWLAAGHVLLAAADVMRFDPAGARHQTAGPGGTIAQPAWRFLSGLLEGAAQFDEGHHSTGLRLMQRARQQVADTALPPELVAAAALIEHQAALALGHDAVAREITAWLQGRTGLTAEMSLLVARTQFARGDHEGAAASLRGVLDDARPVLTGFTRIEGRLLETALAIRGGERTKARFALGTALSLAEPGDVLRPFERADPSVRQLLVEQIGGFGPEENFAVRVHRTLCDLDGRREHRLLTGREHLVLTQLTSQRSLDEVAVNLTVSVNTVKTHVRAIYAKLGVKNRRAAVVAAREQGLA